eukprot:gene7076-65_t
MALSRLDHATDTREAQRERDDTRPDARQPLPSSESDSPARERITFQRRVAPPRVFQRRVAPPRVTRPTPTSSASESSGSPSSITASSDQPPRAGLRVHLSREAQRRAVRGDTVQAAAAAALRLTELEQESHELRASLSRVTTSAGRAALTTALTAVEQSAIPRQRRVYRDLLRAEYLAADRDCIGAPADDACRGDRPTHAALPGVRADRHDACRGDRPTHAALPGVRADDRDAQHGVRRAAPAAAAEGRVRFERQIGRKEPVIERRIVPNRRRQRSLSAATPSRRRRIEFTPEPPRYRPEFVGVGRQLPGFRRDTARFKQRWLA